MQGNQNLGTCGPRFPRVKVHSASFVMPHGRPIRAVCCVPRGYRCAQAERRLNEGESGSGEKCTHCHETHRRQTERINSAGQNECLFRVEGFRFP
jgi:hypothetical protein